TARRGTRRARRTPRRRRARAPRHRRGSGRPFANPFYTTKTPAGPGSGGGSRVARGRRPRGARSGAQRARRGEQRVELLERRRDGIEDRAQGGEIVCGELLTAAAREGDWAIRFRERGVDAAIDQAG